jgi:hypothetical protein
MTSMIALWLPILVSTALVLVVRYVIHTATPWHSGDYSKLPREAAFLDAVRSLALPPGDYLVPHASRVAQTKTPEHIDATTTGPVMVLTVLPNGPRTKLKGLAGWFVYSVVVGAFAAYLATHVLPFAASYLVVFRFVAVAAFLGYALALWQFPTRYARSVTTTIKATVDGLVYALVTAGTFAWLWPH